MKKIVVFILLFCVAGVAHGFEYHRYQPITYDDFIKMIVGISTEHGRPSLTMFKGSYRVRLTLQEYPRPLKKGEEERFTAIPVLPKELLKKEEEKFLYPVPDLQMSLDSIMGRKVSGLFRHYSVYEFKAKVFSKTPETCAITFLWQSSLVPLLHKEVKPGQTIDIYAVLLYFNTYERQGLVLVNEFNAKLLPMDTKDYNKAIAVNPRDAKAYFLRGQANREKGQYDQAIADFSKAIEINPRDAQAYLHRGEVYGDKKQYDRALADYAKVLEIDPRNAGAYLDRGIAYSRKAQLDQAIAEFTRVIEISPKNDLAYHNRGHCYNYKKQYDQAIADFTKALEIAPNASTYEGRGVAYGHKGQWDQSIADLTKALQINPAYPDALFDRSVAYFKTKQYDLAIFDFNKILELDRDNAAAYKRRAVTYFCKKNYDKAWEDVRKLQSLGQKVDPDFLQALQKASGKQN